MLLDLLKRHGEEEVLPQFGTPQVYKIELKR
jgi:hypothetical protein